jgi:predicted RNA-binding Zn ribbon-like protein
MNDFAIVGGHPALDLANTVAPRQDGGVDHLQTPAGLLEWARRVAIVDASSAARVRQAWSAAATGMADASPGDLAVVDREREVPAADAKAAPRDRATSLANAALADVHAIRALIEPALAGESLPAVSRRWASAVARSVLVPGDGRAELEVGTDPAFLIGDRLADALVDLLRTADRSRLRECPIPDGGCGWLFLDRSRNGSRRWCTMDDCGTHAKSRRLTERRRARR